MFDSESVPNENDVQQALPFVGTLSALRVRLDGIAGPLASGDSYTITVRLNGADTALTCVVSEVATTCGDLGDTATVAAGDLISIAVIPSTPARPAARSLRWTALFTAQ
ncbi:MAG TPA: hypothetical protein VJN96_20760 [Vicinamibacterales bacterium]|nr:hypothetical protein [Vicinamibacterales bacterium]